MTVKNSKICPGNKAIKLSLSYFRLSGVSSKIRGLFGDPRAQKILFWSILALAVFIRVYALDSRSLWVDELSVAHTVSRGSLKEVMNLLGANPVLFALVLHYIGNLLGESEFTFRLLPSFFGVGSVLLIYVVARRFISEKAAWLTFILFSFSPRLVYYAKELKHYSGEVFFALLLVLLTERIIHRDSWRNWVLFAVLASLSAGFSHATFFIIPGLSLVLLYYVAFVRKGKGWLPWLVSNAIIGSIFFLLLSFTIAGEIPDKWGWVGFLPDITSLTNFLLWLAKSHVEILGYIFDLEILGTVRWPNSWLALVLIAIGLSDLVKKNYKRFLIYLLAPFPLVFIASWLHRYPYGGSRIILFTSPMLFIAFGQGLFRSMGVLYEKRYFLAVLVVVILVSLPPVCAIHRGLMPLRPGAEIVVRHLEENLKPGDRIYVYYRGIPVFRRYYQGSYENVVLGKMHHHDLDRYIDEIDEITQDNPRLWLFFSRQWWGTDERALIWHHLGKKGTVLKLEDRPGTSLLLFEMNPLSHPEPKV
ncbi:hypothetical protein ES702_04484 [subsurface metagenome]